MTKRKHYSARQKYGTNYGEEAPGSASASPPMYVDGRLKVSFIWADPDPYMFGEFVHVTNASGISRSSHQRISRKEFVIGPPRPTVFLDVEALRADGVVGWYAKPLPPAPKPEPPVFPEPLPPDPPQHIADQFALIPIPPMERPAETPALPEPADTPAWEDGPASESQPSLF